MLITCPYCGPRDLVEFSYQGDATRTRPDQASTDQSAWNAYVFERPNPAGPHREYWQHAGGCRAHLLVVRDTVTHEILDTAFARTARPAAVAPAKPRSTARKASTPASKPASKPAAPRSTRTPKVAK